MKRLHLHFRTNDLDRSISYYTALFGAEPTMRKPDHAKWVLEDPRAHVSVSTTTGPAGFDHAGISLETRNDLDVAASRLREHGQSLFAEEATTCCYAKSNKYWARGPQDEKWELFQTFADSAEYGADPEVELAPTDLPPN